jgi:uncharacterized protein with HEPN domain
MNRNFKVYINEILEAISEIEEFTNDLSYEEFLKDKMAIKAVSMNILLIGENVRLVPLETRHAYPQIPWSKMKSARNFIAHEYPKVAFKDLWDTAKCELPPLKALFKEILENE